MSQRVSGDLVPGRRPSAQSLIQRRRHIRCAYYRLVLKRSTRWLASHFRCSDRTVFLWVQAALGYHDPEAQMLRDLVGSPPEVLERCRTLLAR